MPNTELDPRPLTWDTLTRPSKVMLPVYVLAALWIGYWYALGPDRRLHGPALTVARGMMPMPAWGTVAFFLAVMLVAAFLTTRRQVAVYALCLAGVAYALWAAIYAAGCYVSPEASMLTPMWPLIAGAAHVCTGLSLTRREVHSRYPGGTTP
jgi:hypothetical protein